MKNEKIAEKMLMCLEKSKYSKFDRLFLKHRNNEELWDILLQNPVITEDYLKWQPPENMDKLSISIQKKIIKIKPNLIRLASDELRNDRDYMEELQRQIDSKEAYDGYEISVYQNLGSKLSQDKEYLLSIRDKDPLAFLESMKKVQYDDETVKSFFDEHPSYVRDLPDTLKYNYEYAASLISRLPAEHITMYCGDMTYDYLKNDLIKQSLIKVAGEAGYKKTLLCSLAEYPEQLKFVSPDELKELVILAPDIFLNSIGTSEMFKSILSTSQHRKNIGLIQTIQNTSKLFFKQIDTPEKLSNVLFELSKSVSENLIYDTIINQVKMNWDNILPWIKQIDEWHEMDDGSLEHTQDFRSFYNLYNLLVSIECNKLDQAFKVFINSELRASEYGAGIKNIDITEDNLSFLQFSCTCSFFNSYPKTIDIYSKLFSKINKWTNDPYESLGFIDEIDKNFKLKQLLLNSNVDTLDQDLLINIFSYVRSSMNDISKINSLEELRDYQKFVDIGIEKLEAKNIRDLKHKILLKYFQINLGMADQFIHSYLSSDNNSSLYQDMPEVKYLKDLLEKIANAADMKELEEIDNSLSNQNSKATLKDIYKIIRNVKNNYGKEINSSLLQVNNTNGIIDATNVEFNLLVHVIGAYGSVPTGDIYDSWNTKEKTSTQEICTSFISDNNMGIAPTGEHSVILGFNNLPDDFLEIMSCNDLYSKGFQAARQSRFLTPEELKNNTRHGHNEIVIRRRKGEYTEEKVEPSYIICFDNINEESKVASEKFGVPIIFIDREKVAERHYHEIMNLKEQFKTTLDPHLISKIICEQENNKAGLRLVRPDLVEKYFSTEIRQQNIEELYSAISNGLTTNNPNAINAMNEFVKVMETEASKFVITKETPHRKNSLDIKYEEFLQVLKSNPAYKQDFELPKELTLEEIYQKFIECRDKLTESERMELQYINSQVMTMESSAKKVGG